MSSSELMTILRGRFHQGFIECYGSWVVERRLTETLLDLTLYPDVRIAFRAAYLLEYVAFNASELLIPYYDLFVRNYGLIVRGGTHRHYAKILAYLLKTGSLNLNELHQQQIAEITFDRLLDTRERPAVKVWSMEILDHLSGTLDWVDEELYDTLQYLMTFSSAALCNRGMKICHRIRLRRQILCKE